MMIATMDLEDLLEKEACGDIVIGHLDGRVQRFTKRPQ